MIKKFLFYSTALMVVTLLTIVIAEIAIRALFPALNPSTQLVFYSTNTHSIQLGLPGQTYRHRHNAGDFDVVVTFNELGLRDTADVRRAKPNDWFFVGDSFGFGFGVAENERVSSVMNASILGASIPTESTRALPFLYNVSSPTHIQGYGKLLIMADELVKHDSDPNPVLLLIFTGNDLFDYEAGVAHHTPFASRSSRLRFYVSTQSALYQSLRYLAWNTPGFQQKLRQKSALTAQEGYFVTYNPRIVASSAEMTSRILIDGSRPHWIVLAPPKSLWTGRYREEWSKIHYGFAAALHERGLRVTDLAPLLEQRAAQTGADSPLIYYFPTDGHWNPAGNAAVAEILMEAWAL